MKAEDDFSAFVSARWPRLVRSAILLGCSPVEAEDVAQSTLECCLRRWNKVQQAHNRDAYVHRALVNTFISSRRGRSRKEAPVEFLPDQPVSDATQMFDAADAMGQALARLPEDQRIALVLRYYLSQSETEMADVLGVAPGTVKSRLSRAKAALSADPNLVELREMQ
ncbi:unannotated protein [freshwater metagenome]|jgi:RNA polymerase sigma-70 factor (sigma-E family)|uniref:Unannotated protein n=1 Tax=freshwater metagenome TaxID=449393 RepID=A0A6J7KYC0_9ZZZZ|nr:SigE family RNA polymerase sigma factor [Actinomycetota bacterium]